ncbi:MAG: hypothetical protein IJ852_00510 [Alphaproteobacteria bacterium]|nr:hypothetical protein [Alphaproteobacteria bacterium]
MLLNDEIAGRTDTACRASDDNKKKTRSALREMTVKKDTACRASDDNKKVMRRTPQGMIFSLLSHAYFVSRQNSRHLQIKKI